MGDMKRRAEKWLGLHLKKSQYTYTKLANFVIKITDLNALLFFL